MVLDMSSVSEEAVETALDGYLRAQNVVGKVFQLSEQLRILQDEVAELATELIARYQPVATDLRYIRSCMEIAYGFSRYGRYAYDIAQVLTMFGDVSGCDKTTVEETGRMTRQMMKLSITSFRNRDSELAKQLESLDNEIDRAYAQHISKSVGTPSSDKKCDMATALILRYLERISDHAEYIGETVQYIVTGERTPRR